MACRRLSWNAQLTISDSILQRVMDKTQIRQRMYPLKTYDLLTFVFALGMSSTERRGTCTQSWKISLLNLWLLMRVVRYRFLGSVSAFESKMHIVPVRELLLDDRSSAMRHGHCYVGSYISKLSYCGHTTSESKGNCLVQCHGRKNGY
jgi:hypothetical protein